MFSILHAIVATVLILVLYGLSSFAVRTRWEHKFVSDPLKIIADASGRASLSSAQVFFFTLIVLWLAIYWVVQEGKLISIDNSVLGLLGIAIVGSGVGKITDSTRFRANGENWAWARKKNWIKKDFTKGIIYRSHIFLLHLALSRVTTESQFRETGTWQAKHRGRLTAKVSR